MQQNIFKTPNELSSTHFVYGMISGFTASLVIALIIIIKTVSQILPDYDILAAQSDMFSSPADTTIRWILHFIIGTFLWGILYTITHKTLGKKPLEKGAYIWSVHLVTCNGSINACG